MVYHLYVIISDKNNYVKLMSLNFSIILVAKQGVKNLQVIGVFLLIIK